VGGHRLVRQQSHAKEFLCDNARHKRACMTRFCVAARRIDKASLCSNN
jgi:hypothetical protein